ncbi:Phytochrome interacting factor 3 [Heracleum sosnowskyi]|uniref:Phytochrome interacting factor 3 n=1 Tax=Heracleum sosnowskyi TaxID=360622 RepID=A0AAD8H0L3_9APIA|nr:Phytochrome interacting factor 3 [Heracleum sosnowskyi]KAK1357478.1 Phytochrome interacting factor 3 [Heracleum sosnowskyi]
MEIFSSSLFNGSSKRYNRKRPAGYNGTFDGRRKSVKTVTLGGSPKRSWRMKTVPKLKFKLILSSPMKLWRKLKNGYMNVMLNLGSSSSADGSAQKRIPKARQSSRVTYTNTEFDNRLVFEIYKSLVTSHELATI